MSMGFKVHVYALFLFMSKFFTMSTQTEFQVHFYVHSGQVYVNKYHENMDGTMFSTTLTLQVQYWCLHLTGGVRSRTCKLLYGHSDQLSLLIMYTCNHVIVKYYKHET